MNTLSKSTSGRSEATIGRSLYWLAWLCLAAILLVGTVAMFNASYRDWVIEYFVRIYSKNWPLIAADFFVWWGVLAFVAIIQGWDSSALKRLVSGRGGTNVIDLLTWFLRTTYITEVIIYVVTFGLMIRARWIFASVAGIETKAMEYVVSPVFQQIIYLVLLELVVYWVHRLEHQYPALWAFHKFHHSASEMNVLTSRRVHPVESHIIRSSFLIIPFALVGLPFQSFIILKLIMHVHAGLVHSGVHWGWGWIGKYILVSPKAHALHHSIEERHQGKNFANVFIFLDHLFGTYAEDKDPVTSFGVVDDTHNDRHLVAAWWKAVEESYSSLRKSIAELLILKGIREER